MLILTADFESITGLAFSPDGLSLVASGETGLQVWPRWLDRSPLPIATKLDRSPHRRLEDYAFVPNGDSLLLYLSGDSHTRLLDVKTGKIRAFPVPIGPSWFHCTCEEGYVITCHGRGRLSRYEYVPGSPPRVVKHWTINRRDHGSHYLFGKICGPAGTFLSLEYNMDNLGDNNRCDGLAVRSVIDGVTLYHQSIERRDADRLLTSARRRLTIHPSGSYFAFPMRNQIRLWSLARHAAVPPGVVTTIRTGAIALDFHPAGELLAAAATDRTVKFFDTRTWKVLKEFSWGIGRLQSLCFSSDGTHAAAGSDSGQVVVWDVDA